MYWIKQTNSLFCQWQNHSNCPGILFYSPSALQHLNLPLYSPSSYTTPCLFFRIIKSHTGFANWEAKCIISTWTHSLLYWTLFYGSSGFSKRHPVHFSILIWVNAKILTLKYIYIYRYQNLHDFSEQQNWIWRSRYQIHMSQLDLADISTNLILHSFEIQNRYDIKESSRKVETNWSKFFSEIKCYFCTQSCLLYWDLWPAKRNLATISLTPFTLF